ncbi:hypothetical protein [Bradyrhizobium sp. JR3.5]
MVRSAQRGRGDTGNRTAQHHVAVTEEDVLDLAPVLRDDRPKRGIVEQADPVHRGDMRREWIVMHEQEERTVMLR